jgi:sugar phosphate isomerase/epimerase
MAKPVSDHHLSRRAFVSGGLGAAALAITPKLSAASASADHKICSFVKFVQSLSYDELAEKIAELGFDGIEATIRNGGQIEPNNAVDELPKLVEALKKHDVEITIMASSINSVDQPNTERILRAAALLGVKRYRLAYYRYDPKRSVTKQLQELKPVVKDLAALNHDLGITGVYQNHAGARFVGSTIWDLRELFQGISHDDMAIAFDIRHATAEAGLSWPLLFNVASEQLGAIYVKDFAWHDRRVENVPLGKGRVDKSIFNLVKASGFTGPMSLHIEYLEKGDVAANLAAMKNDLATLRTWLAEAKS